MFVERSHPPVAELNPMTFHTTVCGGKIHHLEANREDERGRLNFYLREVEFHALLKWLELLTTDTENKISHPRLFLGDRIFTVQTYFSGEQRTVAECATQMWQKLGFGVELPFGKGGDENCWVGPYGTALRRSPEYASERWYFTKAPLLDEQRGHYVSEYQLEQTPAFHALAPASVVLADRLLGIIAMGSAPDGGYDLQLRNGLGDLNVLQQADRLGLARIAEDLIR